MPAQIRNITIATSVVGLQHSATLNLLDCAGNLVTTSGTVSVQVTISGTSVSYSSSVTLHSGVGTVQFLTNVAQVLNFTMSGAPAGLNVSQTQSATQIPGPDKQLT